MTLSGKITGGNLSVHFGLLEWSDNATAAAGDSRPPVGVIAPYRVCRQLLDGKLKSSDGALAVG